LPFQFVLSARTYIAAAQGAPRQQVRGRVVLTLAQAARQWNAACDSGSSCVEGHRDLPERRGGRLTVNGALAAL